jgi:hypothetical protein
MVSANSHAPARGRKPPCGNDSPRAVGSNTLSRMPGSMNARKGEPSPAATDPALLPVQHARCCYPRDIRDDVRVCRNTAPRKLVGAVMAYA